MESPKDPILDRAHGAPIDWAHLYDGDIVIYHELPHTFRGMFQDKRTKQWSILIESADGRMFSVNFGDQGLTIRRSASG